MDRPGNSMRRGGLTLLLLCLLAAAAPTGAQTAKTIALPDQYYPQLPKGQFKLNYYYDRSGRWVKFSDWIPFKQLKSYPRFLEDYYQIYGLPHHYKPVDIKEAIYFLLLARSHRFRHPRDALCKIETSQQYHKYRLLMFMKLNLLLMRMHLRLGSMYDKRHLYFHDLDFSDDLEVSFLIARTYYREAYHYWKEAVKYARQAHEYPFEIDLPQIESERYRIVRKELDYDRIIGLHVARVDAKLGIAQKFLAQEGKPRPVKRLMQSDIERMYDDRFSPSPLDPPVLDPEWKEKPLFPEEP